ncbi:MAG: hypothetical protein U1A27_13375 [Phycisphaerae bacterium]
MIAAGKAIGAAGWLPWALVLALVLAAGVVGVALLRRGLRRWMHGGASASWTLQDLREMHARGQITDAEMSEIRARLIARSRTAAVDQSAEQSRKKRGGN